MNRLEVIDRYAARLLMVTFFLPMKLQVWMTMAVSVYFIVRAYQIKTEVSERNFFWALVLGGCFLMFLLAIPFTRPEYMKPLLSVCQHRVSVLLMPVLFAFISPKFRKVLMKELMYFVYGCVITCIAANADVAWHYFFVNGGMHTLTHVDYRGIVHLFSGMHPTYLSMYLCFSICIILLAAKLDIRVHPFILNSLLYVSFISLLALGAKTPIVALALILIHYAWAHRRTLYRYTAMFIGLLGAAAGTWFFVPFVGQRMREMVQGLSTGNNGSMINSINMRKVIWHIDTGLIKNYWLTGTGPGRLLHVMQERYLFYSVQNHLFVRYHDPHCEYFFIWLSFGIAGIAVFLATLIIHTRKALINKDHLYLYLLIILCATFFTETVLSQQRGVLFYAVFTSLFFFNKKLNSDH